MGGHSVALAAALRPQTFSSLVLIEPVIRAPDAYIGALQEEHFAAKRRNRWSTWEEMYERFKPRLPFSAWDDEMLREYCRYGLLPDDGSFILGCPPKIEASIYQNSPARDADIGAEIARVDVPVVVMRAPRLHVPGTQDMGASPTDPRLASRFPRGRDILMKDNTHFIPMENPDRVAAQILEAS
jgi:pimeloyl-ACP methyl ester carboxylesterase